VAYRNAEQTRHLERCGSEECTRDALRNLTVEGLTLYGRLRQLHHKFDRDESGCKVLFGERSFDDHTICRAKLSPEELHLAGPANSGNRWAIRRILQPALAAARLQNVSKTSVDSRGFWGTPEESWGVPQAVALT
jgi:hypothetical protein